MTLDINRILGTHIPDIAPVYGGVRGPTISSRHQSYAWPIIRDAGIHTIIDLREDSLQSSMQEKCAQNGMRYFYYPVDNRCNQIESMVKLFPDFFSISYCKCTIKT